MLRWTPAFVPAATATATATAAAKARDGAQTAAAAPAAVPLDPYFRWALASQWRGLRRTTGTPASDDRHPPLRILVQGPKGPALLACLNDRHWQVPPVYRTPIAGAGGVHARHFTATVQPESIAWLMTNPHGIQWELAVPFRDAETVARANRTGLYGQERENTDFRPVLPLPGVSMKGSKVRPGLIKQAIAIIDFGCPFLNGRFAKGPPGKRETRIAALWDQGSDVRPATDTPTPWVKPRRAGYGRELAAPAMKRLFGAVRRPPPAAPIDEGEAYRHIDYLIAYDDPRRRIWRSSHGAHVMDMAGGERDPLTDPLTDTIDAAGRAPLVFVQLPALTAADSSGGSLGAQVLDAVRYVLDVCTADAPIVVNISYGSFAGPHDGSTLVEQALDELLELRAKDFAVVLSAGNARQAGCHVQRSVRSNRSALLRVNLAAGGTTDTFVEIWYRPPQAAGVCIEARVRTAEREWSAWVAVGEQALLLDASVNEPVAMLRHDDRVPNGAQALILLSLAPTLPPQDGVGPPAPAGAWEVEVRLLDATGSHAELSVALDAWIERDDPGDGGDSAQSTFSGLQLGDADNTLSSLATGKHTIVVGGFRRSDGMVAAYSSTGPGGRPQVHAACEDSALQPTVRAAAVRSKDTLRMNGTSVAAPVLARRLFNWLMGDDNGGHRRSVGYDAWAAAIDEVVALEHAHDADGRPLRARAVKIQGPLAPP